MTNFYIEIYFIDAAGRIRIRVEEVKEYESEIMRAVGRTLRNVSRDEENMPEGTKFYVGWLGKQWFFDTGGFIDETHEGSHLIVMDERMVREENIKSPSVENCAYWAKAMAAELIGQAMRGLWELEKEERDKKR